MSTSLPPRTAQSLYERAQALSGLRLGQLAHEFGVAVPADLRRHKGWIGRLLEDLLGADGGNAPAADFSHLGIELKSIPVNRRGRPLESTFVCTAPLAAPDETTWQTSQARSKLKRVLWIPILTDRQAPVAERMVGSPLLWSPSPRQEKLLARDWREHVDVIRRGYVDEITAHDGEILQIRPKGASADSRTWSIGPQGQSILTLPRAFYLRARFTRTLLEEHFAIA